MTLLLRLHARALLCAAVALLGFIACQEPGADWVEDASTADSSSASNGVTSSVTTSDGSTDTVTSTEGSNATTDTSSGTGGSGTTTDGGVTNDSTVEATNDSTSGTNVTTATDTTSDTTSTTGSGGTGGGAGDSLIVNGDFSDGETGWEVSGDGSVDVSSGEYCVTLNNAGTVYTDWPSGVDSTTVRGGESYVFSYRLYYSGSAATVSVKIGQPVDPYNAYAEGAAAVTMSPQTFMQSFTMDSDDQVGIRFTIDGDAGTRVCIDDVRLVAQ